MYKQSVIKTVILIVVMFFASHITLAQHDEKEFDLKEVIFHHIGDSHEWHFATIGEKHYTLPLPVLLYTDRGFHAFLSSKIHDEGKAVELNHHGEKTHAIEFKDGGDKFHFIHEKITLENGDRVIDFSITKNVVSILLSAILLFVIFMTIAKRYKKTGVKSAPKGMQSFFEPIITFVRDDIAKENISSKHERFVPYLLTVFFFIWFNNLLGLMPSGANVTGNIAVTLVLAVITWIITTVNGNKNYWKHIFATPGVPVWLLPLMIPVEIIGMFTKPFSLMIRLFANITAGHILILSLISLIFIFKSATVSIASVPFAILMNCLELFVAILQAYVFTLLTAMYFGSAVEEHH